VTGNEIGAAQPHGSHEDDFMRSTMRTSMKAIPAALGVALLAAPAMAQTRLDAQVPVSTDNVFWGLAYSLAPAPAPAAAPAVAPTYGAVAMRRRHHRHARAMAYAYEPDPPAYGAVAPAQEVPVGATTLPRILDCVHVTFPQCGAGAGGN
jgi:hypothetical protein